MDSLKSMNDAMKYIEENLMNEIDFKVVARIAHCSEYHFKRMFSFLAGILPRNTSDVEDLVWQHWS